MRRTTVFVPDDVDVRLRHLAAVRGTTISALTREALEEYVGPRTLGFIGAGRSGCSDVSERIEKILAEEWGEGAAGR